jgi:hypothetical protein
MDVINASVAGSQFDPVYQLVNTSVEARCSMGGFCAPLLTYDFVFKTGLPPPLPVSSRDGLMP